MTQDARPADRSEGETQVAARLRAAHEDWARLRRGAAEGALTSEEQGVLQRIRDAHEAWCRLIAQQRGVADHAAWLRGEAQQATL